MQWAIVQTNSTNKMFPKALKCAQIILLLSAMPILSSELAELPPPHDGNFPMETLHNGNEFPLVGLGGCSGTRKSHVLSALRAGYRHIDTAQAYSWGYREDEVGDALLETDVPREQIFIQSKIHPEDLGYQSTKKAVAVSLERLHISRLDSILLHKPRCWEGACKKKPEGTWKDSWKALEEFYDSGELGAIGICDVDDRLLAELLNQRIKPHIIQNWMDPFHQDKHIRKRCQEENIQYQAYSTLGNQWNYRGSRINPVWKDPTLRSIANAHGADVAQVVINWATRHGVAVVPASTNSTRQKSNLDSFWFDLTDEEMGMIDALDGTADGTAGGKPKNQEVSVTFENRGNARINSYWVNESSGEEVHVGHVEGKNEMSLTSFHGHKFVFKELDGSIVFSHTVTKDDGHTQRHIVKHGEL